MAELEIVVRARDQITETLRRIGTNVDRLAKETVTQFQASGGAVDQLALGLAGAGTEAGIFGTQAGTAATSAARLGTVNVDPLRASITATRIEIDRIAATSPVSPEAIARMADLEAEARRAEDALIGLGGVDIDITGKIAQAQQAFERLGSEASLVPLQVEISRARAEVERLRASSDGAEAGVRDLNRVRIDQLARDIKEGEAAILGLKRGAESVPPAARGIGTAFTASGAAIKSALLPLLPIFGLVGAAFFAKKAAEDSLAFTSALGQIRTEGALTEAEIAVLGETARATARSLGLSDADAAPVLLAAVTDGAKNAADGLERYNAALRLSTVTGGEVKRVTDVLTSTLNAYARQGLGAARASDVLFEVSRAGKVEIDALAGGLEGVLPLASQLGISFEELGAVLVTATKQGGGFEQGVQAIRATLGALTNISDEGAEALRGIDYSSAAIRARGLVPVLADISARLNGNSDAIRAVFPDGRSFGALLAVLANDGRDLSAALAELAGSSGAVEDALGRKLQSPLVQLGIIVNRLRSELGDRLGAAFTDAVSRAVATLGGLEAAAKKIGDLGALIGAGLGSGLGVLGEVISDQVERLSLFIEKIGGAEAIVGALEAAARLAASSVGVVLVISRAFFALSIEGLEKVRAGWSALLLTLNAIPGVDLAIAGLDALIQSPAEAQDRVAGLNRELSFLEGQLAKANAQKLSIAPEDTAGLVLINSRISDFEARITSVKGKIEQVGDALSLASRADAFFGTDKFTQAESDLDGFLGKLDSRLAKPRKAEIGVDVGDLEESLSDAEGRVELFNRALADLRIQAESALGRGFTDDTLRSLLTELARRAVLARDGLNESTVAAQALRQELARALQGDLADKQAELKQLEQGLLDARSAAELLGAAGAALDDAFKVDAIAALKAEVAALKSQIEGLRGETIVVKTRIEKLPGLPKGGLVLPIQLAAGKLALDDIQRQIEGIAPDQGPFSEMLERFRSGIEPSLERQANAVDRQVARQRTSIALQRALGLLDAGRLASLEQATDELDKQADSLRDQAAEIRRGLRLEAIALGIEPNLDEDVLRQEIERVRERTALETEAIRLGVSVSLDDEALTAAVRDARAALDAGLAEIQRDQFEREAIRLGVSLDSDTLELDVARARDDAQAFADSLQGEGLRREAITLGIDISGRSVEQIRQDIASVRNDADAFAASNPIASEALVSGIRGFGNAIGAIASGAQTAKEALSSFFQSFVQQVAGAIAQALLLKAIIAAVGAGSPAGAFLTSVFGGGAKDGAVFPAARGMAVPALAAAALAMAPLAMGAPIGLAAGGQPVTAFAQGGSPHLDRVVSAPTYAPLSSLAGSAVVPLSGGGIETTGGDKLPVKRVGRELVVAAAQGGSYIDLRHLIPMASGGAPVALYGEAGPEAIMRTYTAPGGGPGLRMESGGVAPLTRVSGGRLGLALADGGAFQQITPLALGGLPASTARVLESRPVVPVNISVPVNVNVAGGGSAGLAQEDPRQTEARLQAAISTSPRVREAIAAVVSRELEARPTFRANIRGDRA
jgi:TP901 family phage tail tape measure protein